MDEINLEYFRFLPLPLALKLGWDTPAVESRRLTSFIADNRVCAKEFFRFVVTRHNLGDVSEQGYSGTRTSVILFS